MKTPPWLTSRPIAHRGLHSADHPENSLGAFAAAVKAGYAIELDVHLTADHQLIVHHDRTTTRLTGRQLRVTKTLAAELAGLRLAGTHHHIPTLPEVLDLVHGHVPLIIEIKNDSPARLVGPLLLKALSNYQGDYVVASFDPRIVNWLRLHAPHIVRGQIAGNLRKEANWPEALRTILRIMPLNWLARPQFIIYDVDAFPSRTLKFWQRTLRVPTLLWPVNTPAAHDIARTHGHNIIFDHLRP